MVIPRGGSCDHKVQSVAVTLNDLILYHCCIMDISDWFYYSFFSVLGRFLDVEHLISLCIQIPKKEDIRTAEARITEIIYLKHTLELVQPLQQALKDGENQLFKAYEKVLLELVSSKLQKHKSV